MANKRYVRGDGTAITRSTFPTTTPSDERVITETVYEEYQYPGETGFSGRKILYRAGQRLRATEIDRLFSDATITGVDPASGPAAGGTVVTITGTSLRGTTGVTFGGTPATAVTVVSDTEVTATTPAGAAGAVDVVVTDDSGPVTATGAYTYV